MTILFTCIISFLGITGGKYLFRYWMNHLTIYCIIWGVLIFLYELKLLPYWDVIPLTWFFIVSAFLSFLLGILTITSIKRNSLKHNRADAPPLKINIFQDGGKAVKYALIFSSTISLFAAVQHWLVLIDTFGSIPLAVLNANIMYKMNISGGVKGVIPFIANFGPVAIFFSGIYTAYRGKFSFLTFLPFLSIVLEGLATVGRAGLLFALMEFIFSFFLFRYLLITDAKQRFKFSKGNAIIAFSLMITFFIIIISFVRLSRVTQESYDGASSELRQLKGNLIITPSIYLYLSCDIGVLNQYLKSDGEKTKFGENTFMLFHYILADLKVINRPKDLQKNYRIPMWANTGTYIRELHADFGVLGVYLGPFLIGLLATWLWYKFFKEHSIIVLAFLTYLYIIIGFSFLMMITRLAIWSISIVFLLAIILLTEKVAMRFSKNH